ncbi:two-component system sensor histidine kinase RpfC [Luteibacter jiangsuensis]|uniref:histidine kinase n=1 Tax=Luteibacter jiangsuensis TaxID=637577 RepID=A0ABT9T0A6_9GAMM|nr:ATP-binding protein [Luteibacter jiangsuensis]MDQ0010698.1 two-component system sensor histidine kinase RpfC [Luteibacter jiangsuensis]
MKIDGGSGKRAEPVMLSEVAERLRNPRIDRIVASFREYHVSLMRTVVLGFVVIWSAAWLQGPVPMAIEAHRVVPVAAALFVLSAFWMLGLRAGSLRQNVAIDAVGGVTNFVMVAVLLKSAFMLLITLTPVLPFLSVALGVRYSRRAFVASVAASVAILAVVAPDGFWIARPAYALYALALVIVLPMTLYRMMDALREVSAEAIASREAQHRFISMMSHEMRTPLGTVIHAASLLDTSAMNDDQRRLVALLSTNANALLHRVNAVLDVASFAGGSFNLRHQAFAFDEVLATVGAVCRPYAAEKRIAFSLSRDASVEGVFAGDPGRIEQVLSNLASNALKFTPPGGSVDVRVELLESVAGRDPTIVCTVTDTGIGIADSDKQRIFDPFHQLSAGESRRQEGVGLGLYIVRNVSEQMQGSLDVGDNPMGGSVFSWRFTLPRAAAGARSVADTPLVDLLDDHRVRVAPLRCLVVDDNAANREIVGRILERAGHQPVFGASGDEALSRLASEGVDLIFMDLHMPGSSGWDVLGRIEVARRTGSVPPIVMLSADSSHDAVRIAFRAGARAYLTKPIAAQRLLDVIEAVAEERELAHAVRHWQPVIDSPADGRGNIGTPLDEMRALSSQDEFANFVDLCAHTTGHHLDALRAAIASHDIAAASEAVHALRNVLGNLGVPGASRVCDDIAVIVDAGGDMRAASAEVDALGRSVRRFVEIQRQQAGVAADA